MSTLFGEKVNTVSNLETHDLRDPHNLESHMEGDSGFSF